MGDSQSDTNPYWARDGNFRTFAVLMFGREVVDGLLIGRGMTGGKLTSRFGRNLFMSRMNS